MALAGIGQLGLRFLRVVIRLIGLKFTFFSIPTAMFRMLRPVLPTVIGVMFL